MNGLSADLVRFGHSRHPEVLTGSCFAGTHSGVRPRCAREVRSPGHETSPQEAGGPVSPDEVQSRHSGKPADKTQRRNLKGCAFVNQ